MVNPVHKRILHQCSLRLLRSKSADEIMAAQLKLYAWRPGKVGFISVYLCQCIFVSVYLTIFVYLYLCIGVSVYLYMYIFVSVYLCISLSVYLCITGVSAPFSCRGFFSRGYRLTA